MRKLSYLLLLGLLAGSLGAVLKATRAGDAKRAPLTGDYVEARTASVFAGACHYNGERQTAGREAVMAWSFTSGAWRGVDVAGARVLAVVSADANLAGAGAAHRADLVIDAASDAQAAALQESLTENYGAVLGRIANVRRAAINFRHEKDGAYQVTAQDVAGLAVAAMPNKECCRMPHLVWYQPLAPIEDRRVGFTEQAFYAGGAAGVEWQRQGENSAFYGQFAF